ncbi:MAG: ABC transporter ATP-binding protein/permease [Oscillospiraceae bacterium]|nr:ABC transporter ATP-binding protein/permease [Oscillospiraceae bacterium]
MFKKTKQVSLKAVKKIKDINEHVDFKAILKLLKYFSEYKFAIIAVVILSIGSTIFYIIGPNILGNVTTELYNGIISKIQGGDGINFNIINSTILMLVILYLISFSFGILQAQLISNIAQKISYKLRDLVYKKINKLPMSYFDNHQNGEFLSIVTNDIDTLSSMINQSLTQIITSIMMLVGIVIVMLSINWILTLISLFIMPASFGILIFIVKKSQIFFFRQQNYLGHINAKVEETYSGENIIKAFNNQQNVKDDFAKLNETMYKSSWKSQFYSGLMMPIMQLFGNLGYVIITVVGGIFVILGSVTVGNIQSFIQYVRMLTHPIQMIAQIASLMQTTAAASDRIFKVLEEDEEQQTVKKSILPEDLKGVVEFSHVKFGYDPNKIIINDFSLKVENGQKIAIVGPTGAGKTTLVKILMRFYDIQAGAIIIDGNNITDFDRNELRKMFGIVLQETWLFNGTIMENIRYGKFDATDEEVINAAKSAYADHFIRTQSDGYNMLLSEDATNISQGQKQLLTIARAILSNPKILILDEATSSVDTRIETLIQKAMLNLMNGRTSFVIAHRLSTIRDADNIIVMNQGDIVETGNHKDLLRKGGFYANLYNAQFQNNE